MKKVVFLLALMSLLSSFTHPKIVWVAIGDSITYLNDHQDETGSRISKGYMTRVKEKLPYIEYINQGHNGWTSGGIADKIEELGIVKADIYTIFLGTNDWWSGRPIGTVQDYKTNTGSHSVYGSFRIIMEKLRILNPRAKIILITPMPRADFVYINNYKNNAFGSYRSKQGQSLSQVAAAIIEIATLEHYEVLDLFQIKKLRLEKLIRYKRLKDPLTGQYREYTYPAYVDIPFDPLKDEYPYPLGAIDMTYDGLHPSDKGYAVITTALVKILRKY